MVPNTGSFQHKYGSCFRMSAPPCRHKTDFSWSLLKHLLHQGLAVCYGKVRKYIGSYYRIHEYLIGNHLDTMLEKSLNKTGY